MNNKKKIDIIGIISITTLFILLTIAGYISYKHIDWDVLKRVEQQELILPTPIPENINTTSQTPTPETK